MCVIICYTVYFWTWLLLPTRWDGIFSEGASLLLCIFVFKRKINICHFWYGTKKRIKTGMFQQKLFHHILIVSYLPPRFIISLERKCKKVFLVRNTPSYTFRAVTEGKAAKAWILRNRKWRRQQQSANEVTATMVSLPGKNLPWRPWQCEVWTASWYRLIMVSTIQLKVSLITIVANTQVLKLI